MGARHDCNRTIVQNVGSTTRQGPAESCEPAPVKELAETYLAALSKPDDDTLEALGAVLADDVRAGGMFGSGIGRDEVLASTATGGIAHWHVTYQVASEELFQIWAKSAGTHVVARKRGDPLPRMVLDGVLSAEFAGSSCRKCQIWWHSMPQPS